MPFNFDSPEICNALKRYPDLKHFLEALEGLVEGDVWIARAPGRMDVMGGISDYSGGLVLQLPIDRACYAAVQIFWTCSVEELERCLGYGACQKLFVGSEWAGYIAGCLVVLKNEGNFSNPFPGMRMVLKSDVPEGKGVSSSASVEVASMKAIAGALQLDIDDVVLAALCQKVENQVVGASCGIMDQMTAMMGEEGKLMKLLCRPCTLLGHVELPPLLKVIGIDSGEQHSIAGSEYTAVRTGTFMGLKILNSNPSVPRQLNYLTELSSEEISRLESYLPEALSGSEFLETYGWHIDTATEIDPAKRYAVKLPVKHPSLEIERVRDFCALLDQQDGKTAFQLGALMHASHKAYQQLGLDSEWTNALYHLTQNATQHGIYGGKISGGGSGGTVCVLVSKDHAQAVRHLCSEFKRLRGLAEDPIVFCDSSNGAHLFGVLHFQYT